MLHNAIMALATAFSDDPKFRDIRNRQYFVQKAESYLKAERARPNVSVVHALSILGGYYASVDDPNTGYLYAGLCLSTDKGTTRLTCPFQG
jgi:hypothetical protein